jgi:hypothetical protein
MSELKSSVSHLVAPPGPAPKLIFDQLEPRMLLSADPVVVDLTSLQPHQPTHSVVVQLLNEVSTTGDQTVNIERVQTFDANNPTNVLSSQVVGPGSNITVVTGKGNDKVMIDLSSLPQSANQTNISVVGGGGDVTLSVIEPGGKSANWQLDGNGAGHVDGAIQVSFTGVDHLIGGGTDTLQGSAADTNWTIDGQGSGSVGATKFEGFANLVGAAGLNDVFTVTSTGGLQGPIDGGGKGTLAITASGPLAWHLDGHGGGTVDGAIDTAFTGVDHLSGAGADTLYGSVTDTDYTIDGSGSGFVGATQFDGFSNLVGPTGQNDYFTFTSTGSLQGYVDGGGLGTVAFDTGTADTLVSTPTGPHSGTFAYGNDVITYVGMAPTISLNTTAEVDLVLPDSVTVDHSQLFYDDTIGDAHFGFMVLKSTDGSMETQFFKAPTKLLKITGGSGEDDLNIMSLDPTFQASLTVDLLSSSYDPFNDGGVLPSNGPKHDSVIRVTGDLNLHGGSISYQPDSTTTQGLVADSIYIGTVAEQTGSTGTLTTSIGTLQATPGTSTWTSNKDYTRVATTGGTGTGATISMSTDDKGNVTAWLADAGTGYKVGDVITAKNPDGSGTVSLTFRNIATSAIITTSLTGGNAGDINLGEQGINPADGTTLYAGGQTILLGSNAKLIADADETLGKKAGKINISTSDIAYRLVSWPADFTSKHSGISIDGSTITGGSTKIYTTAEDLNFSTDVPAGFAGFVGSLATLLNNIPGEALFGFAGINASVILRGATAKINIDDAHIDVAGTLDVKALTKVTTQVNAIASALGSINSKVSIAVGYGQAFSDVEANIGGSTDITASDSVTVSATGSVSSKTVARASSNLVSASVNPQAVSLAIAFAYTDLTDLASVGANATITSTAGNVNVIANGTTSTVPDASTISPIDGAAGVGASVALEFANVQAHIDGTVTALGTTGDPATTKIFSPNLGVDNFIPGVIGNNEIYLPDHGLSNGELVTYTPYLIYTPPIPGVSAGIQDPGTQSDSVPGLTKGSTYAVIVVDKDHIQLAKEPSIALSANGIDPNSTQSLSVAKDSLFDLDAINSSNNTISIAAHGFQSGDVVKYTDGGTADITGLQNNMTYTVNKVDDSTFQLEDSSGNVIHISQGSALGTQTFTRLSDSVKATLNLATIDSNGHIVLPKHGFTVGATPLEVVYESLADDGINSIGGLTNEGQYKLVALDANTFKLEDENGNDINLTDPGGPATQALAYIGEVKSFNPTTAVNAANDTIAVDASDLKDGDAVIYNTDPNYSKTLSSAFNLDAIDSVAHTIDIQGSGFANGDQVTYSAGGNTAITGLIDNTTYTVVNANGDVFQLQDSQGHIVQVAQDNALGIQTFVDLTSGASSISRASIPRTIALLSPITASPGRSSSTIPRS